MANCSLVAAQESAEPIVRQTFLPEEFARFAPRTALDMARQVPGFPIDEGDQQRGFGQADTNVLVNGRRVPGKSNGPVDALGRIPVDTVARLEILDGASLGIGGLSGQVLNIVTVSDGRITGRYRFSPQFRTDEAPARLRDGTVALSGGKSNTEWTLSLTNEQNKTANEGPEFVTDGNGVLTDLRPESELRSFDQPGIAGSLTRVGIQGNVLNLTGEVNWFILEFEENSQRNPVSDVSRVRDFQQTEDEFNFELGADYELALSSGQLKLIGLHRYEDSPTEARVTTTFADERPLEGSLFVRRAEEAETVLRAEYSVDALGGSWQWSLEGTHNFLDIDAQLSVRDENGDLSPEDLPGASSRVEEDRAEVTVSYSRSLSNELQLQASVGAEYSEISQSGELGQTRDFVRPNGFVSLNWRSSDTLNISMQLERSVGQLNFFDVIASVNVNQDRVNATNANLVPPQSWLFNVEVQQALGRYGSVTLSGFYEDISDIVDLIPIDVDGQAPGNIDSATRLGASVNATFLFDPLGWSGARFDLEGSYTDSEVLDPLLSTKRKISRDDYINYEATLRQDFPNTALAAGAEVFFQERRVSTRLDETSVFRAEPFVRLFVENKNVFGATVRASIANLNDRSEDFFRTVFNDRIENAIAFQEERFRKFGLIYRIEFEGSF